MKKIPLTQELVALVDDEDYGELSKFKWHAVRSHGTFYAYRRARKGERSNTNQIAMHRQILGIIGEPFITDHENHNGVDNRRFNIRKCTPGQNMQNKSAHKNGTSKYKGVHKSRKSNRWTASIQDNGNHIHIGTYDTEKVAAKRYDEKAIELFGKFAYTNFRRKT